jgi:hypothetical protein
MKIIILISLLYPPKKGLVTSTLKSNMSDSCRITIRLDNNEDTIVYFPKNKCPEIRTIITLK